MLAFSSVGFSQNLQSKELNEKDKKELIAEISTLLLDNYVYPDSAKKAASLIQKNVLAGKYKTIKSPIQFADIVGNDISSVLKDGHFQVQFNPGLGQQLQSNEVMQQTAIAARKYSSSAFGIKAVKIINGNIGLLELNAFVDTNAASKLALNSALQLLAQSNAIILDLRSNTGGSAAMVHYLCSYFLKTGIHLNTWYSRPSNSYTKNYTSEILHSEPFKLKPLYVLCGKGTVSAAEEFCYNLKTLHRATLIGAPTAGAAHGTFERSVGKDFVVFIPYARTYNTDTNTDWEQVGVLPDLYVENAVALETAEELIFENLRATVSDSLEKFNIKWQHQILNTINHPTKIELEQLRKYIGVFGERTITLENGVLCYKRIGKPKFKMTPMSATKFMANEYFNIEFVENIDGRFDTLIARYQDGRVETALRTPSK